MSEITLAFALGRLGWYRYRYRVYEGRRATDFLRWKGFVSKLIVKTKQPIEIDKREVQMMALDILVQVRAFSEKGRPDFNAFHFRTMRRWNNGNQIDRYRSRIREKDTVRVSHSFTSDNAFWNSRSLQSLKCWYVRNFHRKWTRNRILITPKIRNNSVAMRT